MKTLLALLSLTTVLSAQAQVDTVYLTPEKLADTLYNQLASQAPTGYLSNKLNIIGTDSLLLKTSEYSAHSTDKSVNADKMLQWLYEMNCISVGTNSLPDMDTVFTRAYEYVGEMDFEEDIIIIPFGILNLKFNTIDETEGLRSGTLNQEVSIWTDDDVFDPLIVSEQTSILAGPCFDYVTTDKMGLVIKEDFFIGNFLKPDKVSHMAFERQGVWKIVNFEQIALFQPYPDSVQHFRFRMVYGNDTLYFPFHLNTPDLYESARPKSGNLWGWDWDNDQDPYNDLCGATWDPGCRNCGHEGDGACKLKWCYIPGCSRENYINAGPEKPYLVVTGYRPPMFGQGFKKTWTLYNAHHHNMLQDLRDYDFDIILVKFNMAAKPFEHGLQEAARLFEDFILFLNADLKTGDYFENVIQANSMGEDIVRLALLNMEKKHFTVPGYPHHHCRLNIAYDANLYGANIPLAYQYQVVSGFRRHSMAFSVIPFFLSSFLYTTVMQKSFEELVIYHATATDENIFDQNQYYADLVPTRHWRRQSFLDALDAVDNGKYFIPMPASTRNIAVSLGKISGKNNEPNDYNPGNFHAPGEYWQDWDIFGAKFQIGAAIHTSPGDYYRLFTRKVPSIYFNPFSSSLKHEIGVSQMLEIDNAAGSYMTGIGNFISICDATYFPLSQIFNGYPRFYTHKAVVSALAINPNLWPSDGSMTLNMQQMGLMFIEKTANGSLIGSETFGYPNLAHPSNHFQITPFEAIYIDREIDPHIDLVGADEDYQLALNGFLRDEAEPWYLYLQNQQVGLQARSDYEYYVRRRAKYVITVGNLVTPSTDPGEYVARDNARIDLRAGNAIIIKDGVHWTQGSDVHVKIGYDPCPSGKSIHNDNENESTGETANRNAMDQETNPHHTYMTVLYPNPSANGGFIVKSIGVYNIQKIGIYSLFGALINESTATEAAEYSSNTLLKTGTYLVRVTIGNQIETHKLVVL